MWIMFTVLYLQVISPTFCPMPFLVSLIGANRQYKIMCGSSVRALLSGNSTRSPVGTTNAPILLADIL